MAESNRVNKSPEVDVSVLKGTRPTEYAHILGYHYTC